MGHIHVSSLCARNKLELAMLPDQCSSSLCTSLTFLPCTVTVLTIPHPVSLQPPGSDSREKEISSQESTREKIISVLMRPHEGVPADSPYSIAPRQIVSFYIFFVLRFSTFSAGQRRQRRRRR